MAYRMTTPKQRERLEGYLSLWRSGRVTFVGPEPASGLVLVMHTEPGKKDVYYVTRNGEVQSPYDAGFPSAQVFSRLAGVPNG